MEIKTHHTGILRPNQKIKQTETVRLILCIFIVLLKSKLPVFGRELGRISRLLVRSVPYTEITGL